MDRLQFLEDLAKSGKADAFARYGLAMEYRKLNRLQEAVEVFSELQGTDPDYLPQYLMAAQVLVELGQVPAARQWLGSGEAVAVRLGNHHTLSELQAYGQSLL